MLFKKEGFTLIELIVVIAIVSILSGIILFSIAQYINRSKDAAIQGNLATLIPAGEVYYDHNEGRGYGDEESNFCNDTDAVKNAQDQIDSDIYCFAETNAWSACAEEFADPQKAFCVDSIGRKREINASDCPSFIETNYKCPED